MGIQRCLFNGTQRTLQPNGTDEPNGSRHNRQHSTGKISHGMGSELLFVIPIVTNKKQETPLAYRSGGSAIALRVLPTVLGAHCRSPSTNQQTNRRPQPTSCASSCEDCLLGQLYDLLVEMSAGIVDTAIVCCRRGVRMFACRDLCC